MKKIDSKDYDLLWELIKNSRKSDRKLARTLGSSQPTITRRRAKLEKDFIEGYTALPKWRNVGFEIIVFTFIKSKLKYANTKEKDAAIQKVRGWMMKQPNVIFSTAGEGMGWDGVTISFHKSYLGYMEFKRKHDSELGDILDETSTFISDLDPETIIKPFHFKYLQKAK